MLAMVLNRIGAPLDATERPDPLPGPGEVRLKVSACGVCRTDLHVVDGELPHPRVPIIPGHEIVGRIDRSVPASAACKLGSASACPGWAIPARLCPCCATGHENLCDNPEFTGYSRDGGFATMTIADARFAFPLGEAGEDFEPRALALRRAYRLAVVQDRPAQRRAAGAGGPLWFWRRRAYSGPGRDPTGA